MSKQGPGGPKKKGGDPERDGRGHTFDPSRDDYEHAHYPAEDGKVEDNAK